MTITREQLDALPDDEWNELPWAVRELVDPRGTREHTLTEVLAALPSYAKVQVADGYTGNAFTYLTRDLPQDPIREWGRRLTNLDIGSEFFIKADTPITHVELIELDGRG